MKNGLGVNSSGHFAFICKSFHSVPLSDGVRHILHDVRAAVRVPRRPVQPESDPLHRPQHLVLRHLRRIFRHKLLGFPLLPGLG